MTSVLALYKHWLSFATPEQIAFVDSVYKVCLDNYEKGGDVIVEAFSPPDILNEFKTLADVKAYCGDRIDAELDARWGEDTDPELKRAEAFKEW